MRLSESLRRGILETKSGGIINKFIFKRRRTTLFFEDILSNYIKSCQDAGYANKMMDVGERWGALGTKQFGVPAVFRSIELLNYLAKNVWSNIGLFDHCKLDKEGNMVSIETENEVVTRIIGKNAFMSGVFQGCIISYFEKRAKLLEAKSDKKITGYVFELIEEPYAIQSRDKKSYDRLNMSQDKNGFALKDALKARVLNLKGNRIYFRSKPLIPVENTLFHIIGNENILMNDVSAISYDFFKDLVDKSAPAEKKLVLLKSLLQVTGWGNVTISHDGEKIMMKLSNIPFGLQPEKNNWNFLIRVIEGYLRIIDKKINIEKITQAERSILAAFARAQPTHPKSSGQAATVPEK